VKNAQLFNNVQISYHWTYANALEINITKVNVTCDTLYHSPFFISFIMDLNLNSSWLSCAKYEFELGLVAMCAM
jgi:hypothetical protein